MRRKALLLAALVALVAVSPARPAALATELMPGVTYTREVRTIHGEQVVLHVVVAPRPGGLYRLVPVLSNETMIGTETVSQMQARLLQHATVVGVNGDYYNTALGYPSGIFMRDGVLHGRPISARSSLGIGVDGLLHVGRIAYAGTWSVGDAKAGTLGQLNRPVPAVGAGLFTPVWGGETPEAKNAVDVVASGFPAALPNADLAGEILEVRQGGGTPIPPGGAVLQARGSTGRRVAAAAQPGLPLVARLLLDPWWEGVGDAIGGGPELIRDGRIVLPTDEFFTSSQLEPRHPRTAVAQLDDGRVVLVAVDGRQTWSAGVDLYDLARELIRLGAVRAMAFDGGGGTTMAFEGQLLNTPSDGRERGVSTALMMLYYGVYAPEPGVAAVSPNGDGVGEQQTLAYKLVRRSAVNVRLIGPGGRVAWKEEGEKDPGTYPLVLDGGELELGKWRWVVLAADSDGNESRAERRFTVNTTLGFLRLSARTVRVTAKRPARLRISFEVARQARVEVTVEDRFGRVLRSLYARRGVQPGRVALAWDGRNAAGKPVAAATYAIRVRATNNLGGVDLTGAVVVKRGQRGG